MAKKITMQLGESRSLHRPIGEIERWKSDNPNIVSVTDEDIVTNHHGGQLTAISVGRAHITAVGFDGSCLLDVKVLVEDYPSITVARGGTARLPPVEGITSWEIGNPRVAEVQDGNQVRGMSPGIAIARARGQGDTISKECRVEVNGTFDAEINQTRSLSEFFSVPVRSWRTSTSEVSIDANGTVSTGAKRRTVEIYAELEDGNTFSFDLHIDDPQGALGQPEIAPLIPRPFRPADPRDTQPDIEPDPMARAQRQEVMSHIERADQAKLDQDWPRVGAELTAAGIAAAGHDILMQRVNRVNKRYHDEIAKFSATIFKRASEALSNGRYDDVHNILKEIRITKELQPLADQLRALADLLKGAESWDYSQERLETEVQDCLENTWRAGIDSRQYGVLTGLGKIAVSYPGKRIVRVMVDGLGSPTLASCPVDVRESLETSMDEMGALVIETILDMLSDRATPSQSCQCLLVLFAGLHPIKHGNPLIAFYRKLQKQEQDLLVDRICQLRENSCNVLFDLMAAVLQRLPADPRLAKAIQSQIGKNQMEKDAMKWASHGHKGTQIVLQRLYDYQPTAFGVR